MKKTVVSLLIIGVMASMMSVGAYAHGGGHGKGHGKAQYQQAHGICTVEGCEVAGAHQHSGTWYCGQHDQDGYAVCTVSGCTQVGLHEHGGTYYSCGGHSAQHGCGRTVS